MQINPIRFSIAKVSYFHDHGPVISLIRVRWKIRIIWCLAMRYISVIPKSFGTGRGLAAGRSLNIILYSRIGCFGPNRIKRKWPWLSSNLQARFDYRRQSYWWSSFAGNVFLVTSCFECFVRFRGAINNSRITKTGAEDVTQYLLISRRVWAIVNKDITKRSFLFLKISWHESGTIFAKHSFSNTDLISIARTSEKSHVLSIPADVRVRFSLWKHIL